MSKLKGGMYVYPDNRIRTTFGHNPSTLRLSSYSPNLQQIPRGGTEVQGWVKDIFEAPPGYIFLEADYSALEAVLVGYFANSARYVRMAKLGVHAYMAAHLPEVGWEVDLNLPESEIKALFKRLKKEHDGPYNTSKRVVHLSNYLGTPRKMWEEYPQTFKTIKDADTLQKFYFSLFPEIQTWHRDLCERVDGTKKWRLVGDEPPEDLTPWSLGTAMVQNPFGYLHRFYNVLEWTKAEGEWYSSFGEDAKRLIANLPQSTGSGIVKQAASTLYYDYPDVGKLLRLLIHDSLFLEVPESQVEAVAKVVKMVMTTPIPQLPLDPTWNLGTHLNIGVEIKVGKVWSQMREIHVA
jgi:hypothetical protein